MVKLDVRRKRIHVQVSIHCPRHHTDVLETPPMITMKKLVQVSFQKLRGVFIDKSALTRVQDSLCIAC